MPLIAGTPPIKLSALESLELQSSSWVPLVDKYPKSFTEMERSSTSRGLTANDGRRLEISAQAVIASARLSDNSTGINWRRLPTTPIGEHYLTEYPGLTNQEIALRETLEEVERRVIEHELDLDRIDDAGLQERIEDVLNDILDVMVHDARASSSDGESDTTTDSSGSDDSDDTSDPDHPPNVSRADSHNSGSDAVHVHQARQHQQPHHEAGIFTRASTRIQGPHLPPDAIHPISVPAEEHVPASNTSDAIIDEPHVARGTQERGVNCCSTM